jgi:hypothetical protein
MAGLKPRKKPAEPVPDGRQVVSGGVELSRRRTKKLGLCGEGSWPGAANSPAWLTRKGLYTDPAARGIVAPLFTHPERALNSDLSPLPVGSLKPFRLAYELNPVPILQG